MVVIIMVVLVAQLIPISFVLILYDRIIMLLQIFMKSALNYFLNNVLT